MAIFKEIAKADGSGITTFYRISDSKNTVEVDETEGNEQVIDYNQAQNKPSINGVALVGDKTSEDLGLQPAGDYLTNDEADDKFVDNDELEAKNYVNQAQLAEAIASISHFHREIVDGLPVQGEDNVIYLVRKTGKQGDIYDEYLWVGLAYSSTGYEYLGSTAADLSNYITRDNLNASLATKVDKREGFGLSSNDYTSAEKTKLAGLSNYDDSELRTAVEALHNYDDTEIKADISGLEDDIDAITLDIQNLSDSNSYKITSVRLIKNGDNWSWQNVKGDVLSFAVAQEALGHEDTILVVEDIENDGKYSPIFYRSYNNYILICFENEEKEVFLVNMGTTNSYSRLGKNVKYRGITTSSPVSGNEGDIIIDRDSKLVYIYDGTNWVPFDKGGEVDLSNYLAKDNTTAWIPTGDFNPATKKYVDDSISGIYIPTKTSQLTNDSNFITKSVNNLTNYYLKTNIYTKAEVDALIQGGGGTSDYTTLSNKPQINGITLTGNKTGSDLGLVSSTDVLTKTNTTSYTPSGDYQPATKKYVDDAIQAALANYIANNINVNPADTSDKNIWIETE